MGAHDAIERTLHRYALAFATADVDLLADCFCADAEVVFPSGRSAAGRDAVLAGLSSMQDGFADSATTSWIVISNLLIHEETPLEARTSAFYTAYSRDAGSATFRGVGSYDDVFANEDGTWRIRKRHVRAGTAPDVEAD